MNIHRDYFLRHLGIGEVWSLRQAESQQAAPSPNELDDHNLARSSQDAVKTVSPDIVLQLREEIDQCHQCGLCNSNRKVYWSDLAMAADTLIIYDWSEELEFQPQHFLEFERLLGNIVKALPIEASRFAMVSLLHAQPPHSATQIPFETSAQYCGAFMRQAIAMSKATNLLVFGARAANALLQNTLDIQQLRTSQWHFGELPVSVTWSPYDLLAQPAKKRETWQDLCRFKAMLKH